MRNLEKESDVGNVEYKLKLQKYDPNRIEELASQMRFRLFEGQGEAFYYIGVTDDGVPEGLPVVDLEDSLSTLQEVAAIAGVKAMKDLSQRYWYDKKKIQLICLWTLKLLV